MHWYVVLILFMSINMKPAARTAAKGYTMAKPDSPMNAIYAYRRVLRDCGRHLADLSLVGAQLKAMRKQYIAQFGDFALVRDQQQPLSKAEHLAMLATLRNYQIVPWSIERHDGLLMYVAVAANIGCRSDEQCDDDGMKRANFVPVNEHGAELEVTPDNIRAWRRNGAMLRGRSSKSKCDQDNSHWGSRDIWLLYDDTNPLSLPVIWAEYELKYPCPPAERAKWPMASPRCGKMTYSTSTAAADHKTMCVAALGEEAGRKKTPHAHRVTLATNIMALPDGDEATAQAHVRWKTVESLRIYYKTLPSRYADINNRAVAFDAAKARDVCLPEIDPHDPLERLDEAIAELDGAGRARKRAAAHTDSAVRQFEVGEGVFVDGDTSDAPKDILGGVVGLPYGLWSECERSDTRKRRCEIVAFSAAEGQYVVRDTIDDVHYLFRYEQMSNHFLDALKQRAAGKQPAGKPKTAAQQQQQQRDNGDKRARKRRA